MNAANLMQRFNSTKKKDVKKLSNAKLRQLADAGCQDDFVLACPVVFQAFAEIKRRELEKSDT